MTPLLVELSWDELILVESVII